MVCGKFDHTSDVYVGSGGIVMKDVFYAVLTAVSMAVIVYYIIKFQHLGFTLSSITT